MCIHNKTMYKHGRNRASANNNQTCANQTYAPALNHRICKHYRLITVIVSMIVVPRYQGFRSEFKPHLKLSTWGGGGF